MGMAQQAAACGAAYAVQSVRCRPDGVGACDLEGSSLSPGKRAEYTATTWPNELQPGGRGRGLSPVPSLPVHV